uniref:Uncharacterized protein n=1 Tax=Setaria italica TaxID=4555 RepID=K3YNL8_SETIT
MYFVSEKSKIEYMVKELLGNKNFSHLHTEL